MIWFKRFKILLFIFYGTILYECLRTKINFAEISSKKTANASSKEIDSAIMNALEQNTLTCSHHSLLYEPAFENKKMHNMICAYYPATQTDIYWGDFVPDDKQNASTQIAFMTAWQEAKKNSRFLAFIDINQESVNAIESLNVPFKKLHMGEEWFTHIQNFDLEGGKSRNFRNALYSANKHQLTMQELKESDNLNDINELITTFSHSKKLSFPRVGAGIVEKTFSHPWISRRIWKLIDNNEKLIGAIVLARIGKDQYFVEHGVYDVKTKYKFLFDWCLPQIILQLKNEGVKRISWGRVAHIYNQQEVANDSILWFINLFYHFSKIDKHARATATFKKDFVPIEKIQKFVLYSEFRADLLLDVANLTARPLVIRRW